jgi:hypothetical protein
MKLCQTFEKKPCEFRGPEAIIKGIDRKNAGWNRGCLSRKWPLFLGKSKLFLGWRLMAQPKEVALEHRVVMLIIYLTAMNSPMSRNKFLIVQVDESAGDLLRVTPSKYLDELHPHQAIAEMQDYTQTLEDALQQCQEEFMPVPAKMGKIGGLVFELELVQTFLASFRQAYGTMH